MKIAVFMIFIEFLLIIFVVIYMTKVIVCRNSSRLLVVKIPEQGYILGNVDKTAWTKQNFMQFRGIPYAESPSGPFRFRAPITKKPWNGYIDATKMGRSCPSIQSIPKPIDTGDQEDCLNLCVYTKELDATQPVIFYIYGGGFNNGTALDYPPKFLLEKNIVLVIPHFRVGLLGWAFAHSIDLPGNMALLDLQLALKWVQHNIATFGGDPTKVTIMGQSGGACLAGALMLSPKSESNYFKRAIIMSGSVLSTWAINKKSLLQSERICSKLNCPACEKYTNLLSCFSNASVNDILEASVNEFFPPVVGDFHGVLPQHPIALMETLQRPVPALTGFTKHDGSFAVALYYDQLKNLNCSLSQLTVEQFANGLLNIIDGATDIPPNLLKSIFSSELLKSTNHKAVIPEYIDLSSIVFMKSPVLTFAAHLVRKNMTPVYLYSFDYEGQHTRYGYGFPTQHYPFNGGVHHSDDNLYLFSTYALNKEDTRVAKKMVELWTSFAATGKPSHNKGPTIMPMKSETGPYFCISKKTIVKCNVIQEFMAASTDPNKMKLIRKNKIF